MTPYEIELDRYRRLELRLDKLHKREMHGLSDAHDDEFMKLALLRNDSLVRQAILRSLDQMTRDGL